MPCKNAGILKSHSVTKQKLSARGRHTNNVNGIKFSVLINVLFLSNVFFVFTIALMDVVSVNSITYVLVSCYNYSAPQQ